MLTLLDASGLRQFIESMKLTTKSEVYGEGQNEESLRATQLWCGPLI